MKYRTFIAALLVVLCLSAVPAQGARRIDAIEPNIEIAKTWWDEMDKKWTVVGWPEHRTRFNVLHDGTLLNYFSFHRHATARKDARPDIPEPFTQFAFTPAGSIGEVLAPAYNIASDYHDVVQDWADSETPVLWSEWAWHGYLLRSQIFAHVPGGKALTRGDEPLFAWVRLSIHYASSGLPLEQNPGFGVRINTLSVKGSMEVKHNLNTINAKPKYPRDLAPCDLSDASQTLRIIEPDGRVRMAVVNGEAEFKAGAPTADDSLLYVQLPPKQGAYVDLLIPMLPTDRATFDQELSLGYDGALREAETFWKQKPTTAAKFEVPEDYINQAIRRNIQSNRVASERYPTGEVYAMTGGFWYGIACWGTPVCLSLGRFLDPLGEHEVVETYLKAFEDAQGRVIPPGDGLMQHPGYLGVPPETAIINWLPDHGAILWAMAEHGMLTGKRQFIEEYTPVIVKACEWVRDARKTTDHDGVPGIMPPARAFDPQSADEPHIQSCWTDGWIYKGLTSAVEFLKMTGHPRAAEFEAEANDYRATFLKAFRAKAATTLTWTDDAGKIRHMVPFSLSKEQDWQWRFLFYLDGGPMFLVFAGMMDAADPLMKDAVAWYREGPPSKMYRPYGDLSHVPSLRYEMASWECCYSWNVYHTWQLGDRQRFLEGLYSQFAGAMSQQTYTVCESRGGLTSNIFWIPAMALARLAVIDDEIEQGALHLLRLCPLAWISEKGSTFENMPTKFGPVDLRVKLSPSGDQLQVTFSRSQIRIPHSQVKTLLHVPPVPGLKSIMLNGKRLEWDGKAETVGVRL